MKPFVFDTPRTSSAPYAPAEFALSTRTMYSPRVTFGAFPIKFNSSEFITELLESVLERLLIGRLPLEKIGNY